MDISFDEGIGTLAVFSGSLRIGDAPIRTGGKMRSRSHYSLSLMAIRGILVMIVKFAM
jgi:hypothetical protein